MAYETITNQSAIDALAASDVAAFDDASDLSTDPAFLNRPKTKKVTAAQIATYVQAIGQVVGARVVTASGAITAATTDYVIVVNKTVGAASAVTLPAGVTGQVLIIKDGKGDAAANNITTTPAAGNIDGAGTHVISTNYGSATLVYNGTEWNVL